MESAARVQEAPGETSAPRMETYLYSAASIHSPEDQLFELVQLSDVPMSKQLFEVVVELLRLNIPPSAILHVLKTLKAQATHTTMPPSLQTSRASSRAQTPPTTSHLSSDKPTDRKPSSQLPVEADKPIRSKHRHGLSSKHTKPSSGRKTSTKEKSQGSNKGGVAGSGSKIRQQAEDPSKTD